MKLRKITALVLSLVMLAAVLASCGDSGGADTTEPDAPVTEESTVTEDDGSDDGGEPAASGSYVDYSGGFDETVTIKIPVYDRAFEGWNVTDNYYTQWIQSEFGDKYNVDVQFVAIDRTNEVQDYQQLLASHTAPDIVMHYDMPQAVAYYSEEVLQQLDYDEVAYYAPTFWSTTGDYAAQYGTVDGEDVFVFAERPEADSWVNIIRKDWVEAAGYSVSDITSIEKLNEVVAAWQEAGITGKIGHVLVQNNYNYNYGYMTFDPESEERALYFDLGVANMTTDATKAYLQNLNYQYNNGLLDTEFYLREDDNAYRSEFVAGNIGTYAFYMAANTDIFSSLKVNDPDAEFAVLPGQAFVPEGNTPYSRGYWPFGMIMGINYETDDLSRIAVWMYLEWMSQPDNLMYIQHGVEGQNYELDDLGLPVAAEEYSGESALSNNNNKDYWCLVVESNSFGDPEKDELANRQTWTPPGYEELVDDLIANYKELAPYRTPDALFTVPIEALNEYKADLNTLWTQLYVQCVLASEADFESVYEDACQTFLDAGYQEILDEKQVAIDAGDYLF